MRAFTRLFQGGVPEISTPCRVECQVVKPGIWDDAQSDPKAWIKKTFDELNLARLDTVSIPRQITLHVDAHLLSPHVSRVGGG